MKIRTAEYAEYTEKGLRPLASSEHDDRFAQSPEEENDLSLALSRVFSCPAVESFISPPALLS